MARKKDPEFKKEDLIKMVVEWTAQGVTRARQIQYIKEMNYGVDYAYQLFRDAKPIINEVLKDIGKDILEETISELRRMKLEAEEVEDRVLALNIQKEINKIAGLHMERVDVTTDGKAIENISVIKLVEILKDEDDQK